VVPDDDQQNFETGSGDLTLANYKPKAAKQFAPGNKAGLATRWPRGVSGNPTGRSKTRLQFEEALADALAGENPAARAKELAALVWKAARKGEAWAIMLLFSRLAPEPLKIKMEVSRGEEIDFRQLSNEQIEQLENIFQQLAGPAGLLESGEGPAPPA
jgi:hypothetical protein